MASNATEALEQLSRGTRTGATAELCRDAGVELLVAFGSALHPAPRAEPRDLDLAVLLGPGCRILDVLHFFVSHLGFEDIDLMDLRRADEVARFQSLGHGALLFESRPGLFAELQIQAVVQHADTQWLRALELSVLAK